jgi:hypothetical protein
MTPVILFLTVGFVFLGLYQLHKYLFCSCRWTLKPNGIRRDSTVVAVLGGILALVAAAVAYAFAHHTPVAPAVAPAAFAAPSSIACNRFDQVG